MGMGGVGRGSVEAAPRAGHRVAWGGASPQMESIRDEFVLRGDAELSGLSRRRRGEGPCGSGDSTRWEAALPVPPLLQAVIERPREPIECERDRTAQRGCGRSGSSSACPVPSGGVLGGEEARRISLQSCEEGGEVVEEGTEGKSTGPVGDDGGRRWVTAELRRGASIAAGGGSASADPCGTLGREEAVEARVPALSRARLTIGPRVAWAAGGPRSGTDSETHATIGTDALVAAASARRRG